MKKHEHQDLFQELQCDDGHKRKEIASLVSQEKMEKDEETTPVQAQRIDLIEER